MSDRDLRRERPLPPAAPIASWLVAPARSREPSPGKTRGEGAFCPAILLDAVIELARKDTFHPRESEPGDSILRRHVRCCPACEKWYANACRAAATLLRERTRQTPWRALGQPRSASLGERLHPLILERAAGRDLDGRDALLCLYQQPAGWTLQVRFPSLAEDPRGSEPALLRPWSGCFAVVVLAGGGKRWQVSTRLEVDPASESLVSATEAAPFPSPEQLERARLVLLPGPG